MNSEVVGIAAHTRTTWVEATRRADVRHALDLILAGQPGRAHFHLLRATVRLARIADPEGDR